MWNLPMPPRMSATGLLSHSFYSVLTQPRAAFDFFDVAPGPRKFTEANKRGHVSR